MRILGFEIVRRKQAVSQISQLGPSGWWPIIREPFAGAWQRNREKKGDTVLAHYAVYACVTLIAADMGKMRPKLVERDADGIWTEIERQTPITRLLMKPNHYQNHIQFKEWWALSKLLRGNAYALKERDEDGNVRALYLLDPSRVSVLVSETGDVFYQLQQDNLSGVTPASVTVPASEIIHDRMNCLFHPLVGISPIFAAGLAANLGLNIQENSDNFFARQSNPSGILTAPGVISEQSARTLKERWEETYGGRNSGGVAVLGDGLQFQALRMSAVDSQLIEQLNWTAETVCSAFHVPPFKIGVGTMPTYQNGEILNQIYYQDCLQSHIEQFEAAMDEGLGLMQFGTLGVELDLDSLLRMDTATQVRTLTEGVKGSVFTPNEARRKLELRPLEGGNTVYMQQQNFSLEALNRRDTMVTPKPIQPPTPPETVPNDEAEDDDEAAERAIAQAITLRALQLKVAA